jgi:predicted outer membrane repeat protein
VKKILLFLPVLMLCAGTAHANLKGLVIGVDPGHGGKDPGAIAYDLNEKDINLETALALKHFLELDGARVIMTRQIDESMTSAGSGTTELVTRARFFNSQGVDYVISVHHNSFPSKPEANGVLAYVASGVCNGRSGQLGGRVVPAIMASNGLPAMGGANGTLCPGKPGVFQWNATIVAETQMPAVLAEMSFMTNPKETERLRDPAYLRANGWALYAGLVNYLGGTPVPFSQVVSATNAPILTWPADESQGNSPFGLDLSWDLNNDANLLKEIWLNLAEAPAYGARATAPTYVGECKNKVLAVTQGEATSTCGQLKAGQWYHWHMTLRFKDGSVSEAESWFKTGALALHGEDGSAALEVLDFGEVIENKNKIRKVHLRNIGQDEYQPHLVLSGEAFDGEEDCPAVLETDQTCVLSVTFAPRAATPAQGHLKLYHGPASLGNLLYVFELRGSGIAAPATPPPAAAFSATLLADKPLSVSLRVLQPDSAARYEWRSSDGQRAEGAQAELRFAEAGSYSISLSASHPQHGSSEAVQTVKVGEDVVLCVERRCTVGNGNARACTDSALRQALVNGDEILFNCGGNHTFIITTPLDIRTNTVLDGGGTRQGGLITLDGASKSRIFHVHSHAKLVLRNLTLVNGKTRTTQDAGAAVFGDSFSDISIDNCRLENHDGSAGTRAGGGGAVALNSFSQLNVDYSLFLNNKGLNGAAINVLLSGLTVRNSAFLDNNASDGHGGAIFIDGAGDNLDQEGGMITLSHTRFSGNRALGRGGALFSFVYPPDKVVIEDSGFSANQVLPNTRKEAAGGAIWHGNGELNIVRSTFSDNLAHAQGGALWLDGRHAAHLQNLSFARNRAVTEASSGKGGIGGAITGHGNFTCQHCSFAENHAGQDGGAIYGNAKVTLQNSLFANNSAANNGAGTAYYQTCAGIMSDGGGNIQFPGPNPANSEDTPCVQNIRVADPKLLPLGDYGGNTRTLALSAASPAIDTGANSVCAATDQRGVNRPQDGNGDGSARCDSGTFEYSPNQPQSSSNNSNNQSPSPLLGNSLGFNLKDETSVAADAHFQTLLRLEDGREGSQLRFSQTDTVSVAIQFRPDPRHLGQPADVLVAVHYLAPGVGAGQALWLMRSGATEWKLWDGNLARLDSADYRKNLQENENIGIFYGRFSQLPGRFSIHSGYRVGDIVVFDISTPLEFTVE